VAGTRTRSALDYLVIGHVTQDRVDSKVVLGGTATYAALTARNLGQRVGVLTSAAFEPGLVDVLHGVQVARLPAEETTRFVNSYADGFRQQHLEARAEPLHAGLLLPDWRSAAIVHLAPIAAELQPDLVDAFPRALIGVTPQGWMRAWDEQGLISAVPWACAERILARADATILSEHDVPDPSWIERYAALARLLVVTRGPRGASLCQQGTWHHSQAFQGKREVDPTGAGDVFAAAFLIHLHQTGDPLLSADFANCVASFAIERRHHNAVPTLEQIEERWQKGKRRKESGSA
jgi:sugar/nucleoside kinase (ribokinase family)